MNKTELKQVAKALTLPEGWKVIEVINKGSKNETDFPTEVIRVGCDTKLFSDLEDLKAKAGKIVKQLDKLTAKTTAGTWSFTNLGEVKSDPDVYHVDFHVQFAYVVRHIGKVNGMRPVQLGKKIREDKYLTKAQVKRELNRLFEARKPEAIVNLVRKFINGGKVSQLDLEEIRFMSEAE